LCFLDGIPLDLSGCSALLQLPALPVNGVEEINLSGCVALTTLSRLPDDLLELDLSDCHALTVLPDLPDSLTSLDLTGCGALTALPATRPENLEMLDLSGCHALTVVPAWVHEVADVILPQGHLPAHELWSQRAGKSAAEIAQRRTDWDRMRQSAGAEGEGFEAMLTRLGELAGRDAGAKSW